VLYPFLVSGGFEGISGRIGGKSNAVFNGDEREEIAIFAGVPKEPFRQSGTGRSPAKTQSTTHSINLFN
jgi:hypothetical protein